MRSLNEIAAAFQAGERITPEEYAYLLHNNKQAFLAFLIANNPGGVNNVLRHQLGYTFELKSDVNPKTIARICDMLLEKKDMDAIATIVEGTPLNLAKLSPQLITALKMYK